MTPTVTAIDTFAADIERGLTQEPKTLASKYFYDEQGDLLFQRIMAMPEYYLTKCEYEIFLQQADAIQHVLGPEPFDLIELGAGDGMKTKVLLQHFLDRKIGFSYRPIDISSSVLQQLVADCAQAWPQLPVAAVQGDYMAALRKISSEDKGRKKVILFLGSNIGNFHWTEARRFLRQLRAMLNSG
ncbi:MAG: L-histidine N(alpha)-methyltransferase, partial [Bacteroidetes bacterium]